MKRIQQRLKLPVGQKDIDCSGFRACYLIDIIMTEDAVRGSGEMLRRRDFIAEVTVTGKVGGGIDACFAA